MYTELLKERDSIAGTPVYPQSLNGASGTTGTVDMSKFNRVQFIGGIGTKTNGCVVSCYLQETNNSDGSSATNIASVAITAITNTANNGFTLEVFAGQLTKRYVVGVINVATAAATVMLIPVATEARFQPCNNNDDATVVQRIYVTPS